MVVVTSKVAAFGALDLNNSGAKIGQLARGERSSYRLLHGYNFDAFER